VSRGRASRFLPLTALLVIVGLAAHLRYSGLAWGARHPMHTDEQVYVANVVSMLDAGDFDHRFYTYPALFYYLLAAGIAPLGPDGWHTSDAYVAARGVVATFGVLNVALLAFVVGRLLGEEAGALVGHIQHSLPRFGTQPQLHAGARWRVGQGVADEVADDLARTHRVGVDER